jgi:hypothetical protein
MLLHFLKKNIKSSPPKNYLILANYLNHKCKYQPVSVRAVCTLIMLRLRIKSRLFPLFDQSTEIATTQKILLAHLEKQLFQKLPGENILSYIYTAFWKYQHQCMYLIVFNVLKNLKM